jgi:hypothetical protein
LELIPSTPIDIDELLLKNSKDEIENIFEMAKKLIVSNNEEIIINKDQIINELKSRVYNNNNLLEHLSIKKNRDFVLNNLEKVPLAARGEASGYNDHYINTFYKYFIESINKTK